MFFVPAAMFSPTFSLFDVFVLLLLLMMLLLCVFYVARVNVPPGPMALLWVRRHKQQRAQYDSFSFLFLLDLDACFCQVAISRD